MTRAPKLAGEPSSPAGELEPVIETELRIEAMIAGAREEAARIVDGARRAAQAAEAQAEEELRERAERLRHELLIERDRAMNEIAVRTRAAIERFDAMEGPKIDELAGDLLERLVGNGGSK